MNKIYTDQPDEPVKDPTPRPVPRNPEPPKNNLNKILLGLIVVILIAVVTYFIIKHNRENNGG